LHNGDLISVNGLTLQAIETPGHARHHHIFKMGQLAFTGDVAGIKLNQLPLVDIPAPPPEFDLEAWEASLDLLLGLQLETIYPTHFGPIHQVNAQLQAVKELAPQCAYFVKQQMDAGLDREALIAAYVQWNGERGKAAGLTDEQIRAYEIANPLYMSVDGIMRYWQKRQMAG
jgi:glyoxylase-like metal-dependent hydrolase (beta-lactamase superfamily II)